MCFSFACFSYFLFLAIRWHFIMCPFSLRWADQRLNLEGLSLETGLRNFFFLLTYYVEVAVCQPCNCNHDGTGSLTLSFNRVKNDYFLATRLPDSEFLTISNATYYMTLKRQYDLKMQPFNFKQTKVMCLCLMHCITITADIDLFQPFLG